MNGKIKTAQYEYRKLEKRKQLNLDYEKRHENIIVWQALLVDRCKKGIVRKMEGSKDEKKFGLFVEGRVQKLQEQAKKKERPTNFRKRSIALKQAIAQRKSGQEYVPPVRTKKELREFQEPNWTKRVHPMSPLVVEQQLEVVAVPVEDPVEQRVPADALVDEVIEQAVPAPPLVDVVGVFIEPHENRPVEVVEEAAPIEPQDDVPAESAVEQQAPIGDVDDEPDLSDSEPEDLEEQPPQKRSTRQNPPRTVRYQNFLASLKAAKPEVEEAEPKQEGRPTRVTNTPLRYRKSL